MNENKICPKCDLSFDVKENLKFRVSDVSSFVDQIERKRFQPIFTKGISGADEIDKNTIVICPHCGKEFYLREYRFFGLLSSAKMRIVIFLLLLLFISVPIYILIKDLI
jgi:transcription elongation factor Elf1